MFSLYTITLRLCARINTLTYFPMNTNIDHLTEEWLTTMLQYITGSESVYTLYGNRLVRHTVKTGCYAHNYALIVINDKKLCA